MSDFNDVGRFHKAFGLPFSDTEDRQRGFSPHLIKPDLIRFRLKFLHEEMLELIDAYMREDLSDISDALIDIVYVAMGTAHHHGLPWESLWNEVQQANMKKIRARSEEESKRGSTYDVIKPLDWKPPDILGVLRRHGWRDVP